MGKALAQAMEADEKNKYRQQHQQKRQRSPEQKRALMNIRKEAKEAGAILKSNGEGGLNPDLVLGVMRRDKFTCKVHGDKGEGKFGGLEVHHKGGIIESEWLNKKGHSMSPNNIVTICAKGHDDIHNKAREEGTDSSQVTAKGDKGTKYDHGKPVSKE